MIDRIKLSDNELVQSYINGDFPSLEILINRYKDKVFTYIMITVKNHHLAEDIFQDTFIKVVRSLNMGKYTDNGKFVSWVMRIAHNLIIDHYRKEKNLNTLSNDGTEIDLFNSSKFSDDNIEDLIINEQILSEVRVLVEELPDDQRQVVLMRHYLGLSFKEIADQTGVSINTALGRMRYALINLRKIITSKGLILTKD
ncbi:MAG TPA: sigma-70 family RNA polymerase sigma factor [Prolixibacteraceae bacterium]|nr:sigma-70 family RNA polymerase sigma factor [Prolixibacteraceae bacterium]HPR60367.1 sigma-70 family RNA polymerase sigma factor [Prolixibacteraceae bacterium]